MDSGLVQRRVRRSLKIYDNDWSIPELANGAQLPDVRSSCQGPLGERIYTLFALPTVLQRCRDALLRGCTARMETDAAPAQSAPMALRNAVAMSTPPNTDSTTVVRITR